MDNNQTAEALIALALTSGVKPDNLATFIEELIRIAYINPFFVDAMFRTKNMVDAHNTIRRIDAEIHLTK